MLKEISTEHPSKYPRRRWFWDEYFDLIVWMEKDSTISGFQLCYDRSKNERALTWALGKGFSHERVDDGEANPTKNQTPILVPDGVFPIQDIINRFIASSEKIDEYVRSFVSQKLREYGGEHAV